MNIVFNVQDVDPRCMEEKSNEILTAIVHGMRANEPSNQVSLVLKKKKIIWLL